MIGVTDNLDPEIARYLMPDIKSDFLAFETYLHDQDKATISSPILCFGAEKDLYVDCSQLIHWNKFSSCSFEFFIVPEAYHHYFGEREILKVLHEMLRPYF